jgi:Rrf2 family transcriptional regulator, repressor of oqxAB
MVTICMNEKYILLGRNATVRVANMKFGRHPHRATEEGKGTSMLDVRFSRSLKAMLLLGHAEEENSPVLSSAQLARSLDANPSLVRKMMVPLVQDGLVASIRGRSGGVRLGRPSEQITLGEIYISSIGDKPLWAPRPEGPRECLVTNHSAEYFVRLTDETEAAVLGALAGRTLADGLDELRAIDRAGRTPAPGFSTT